VTSEVKKVTVELKKPSKRFPAGQITWGYYTFENGVLTMTDANGVPAEDGMGRRYVARDVAPNCVTGVASHLTRKLREELRDGGAYSAPKAGFDGPIDYGDKRWRGV
jgi:hypothetical protein